MAGGKRHPEVGDSVRTGVQAGQDAGVGTVGYGDRGEGAGETHAIFGQAINSRSFNPGVAVAAEMIGAQGVNGNQKDAGGGLAAGFSAAQRRKLSRNNVRQIAFFIKTGPRGLGASYVSGNHIILAHRTTSAPGP